MTTTSRTPSRTRLRTAPARLALLAAALLLSACARTRLIDTFDLEPTESRSVLVQGDLPYIIIENDGPAIVGLLVTDARGQVIDRRRILPATSTGQTTLGPATLTLTAPDDAAATITIRAREVRETEVQSAGGGT